MNLVISMLIFNCKNKKGRRCAILFVYVNLLVLILSLGAFTYTTAAWFVANRQQSVSLQSVQVTAPGFTITGFSCFGVTDLNKGPTSTSVTFVNQQLFDMPRYDPEGISFSIYRRAIVVHLTYEYDESTSATLSATTIHDIFSTGFIGEGTFDDNFTSNVFQISPSLGTTLAPSWTQASISYTNSMTQSFVTINPTPTKTTSLTIKTINPGDNEAWFVLEYSESVMMYIQNARMATDRIVLYEDDITYLIS